MGSGTQEGDAVLQEVSGAWNDVERRMHINRQELRAIRLSLERMRPLVRSRTFNVKSMVLIDNFTVVYIV